MTAPITQHEVEQEILRLSRLAEQVTLELSKRAMAAAEAEAAWKVGFAKAFLRAEGAMPLRSEIATEECADLLLEREVTRAREKAAQEAGRNYRTQLDSLRSINANLRPLVTG